jgi:hypothetical protein
MSKLGKLQHLRLIECFNGCIDYSLDAALATLTGTPSLQSHWPAKLPVKRLAGMHSPAASQHLQAYLPPMLVVALPLMQVYKRWRSQ